MLVLDVDVTFPGTPQKGEGRERERQEHRLGEDHGHYEAVRQAPHYHFSCLRCGKVIEFDTPLVAQIEQALCEQEGVRVISAHLHVSGYCVQCRDITG